MDARKRKIVSVLSVASLILVWRVYAVFKKYVLAEASAAPVVTAVDFGSAQPSGQADRSRDDLADILEQQDAVALKPWGRDPFADVPGAMREPQSARPEVAVAHNEPPPQAPSLAFTGVSRSDGRWLAVLDDRIVGVGDVVGDRYRVVKITKHSITLARGRWTLRYELGSAEAVLRSLSEER